MVWRTQNHQAVRKLVEIGQPARPSGITESTYDFSRPLVHGLLEEEEPLFYEISSTRAFRRLHGISFLGAIDYRIPRPNGKAGSRRYSRQQHSLGVAKLAGHFCRLWGVDFKGRRLACAAALLHDIGHAPLSHSLEPVFKERFGIDHHCATSQIIVGKPTNEEIAAVLKRFGIDRDELVSLLEGSHDPFQGFFSGPINFDTIEAITRTLAYNKDIACLPNPMTIVTAATMRQSATDESIVDEFWRLKDQVYRFVINSLAGVVSDMLAQALMVLEIDKFSVADYFLTETEIFEKVPRLRSILAGTDLLSACKELLPSQITYTVRQFDIVPRGNFFAKEDTIRYTQRRIRRQFDTGAVATISVVTPHGAPGDDKLREYQGVLGAETPGFAGWDHRHS